FDCSVLQKATVEISDISVSHAFLLAPDSPVNLLGRDLLCKLHAQIFFSDDKIIVWLPQRQLPQLCAALTQASEDQILSMGPMNIPERLRQEVKASLWGTSKADLGILQTDPVKITLRAGIEIPRIRQYPISREALFGLQELISTFLRLGALVH
ncbi:Pol polyprotein, partial [Chelydra serpentina]